MAMTGLMSFARLGISHFSLLLEGNFGCFCCPLSALVTGRLLELGALRIECSNGIISE